MQTSPKVVQGTVAHGRAILCVKPLAEGEAVFDLTGRVVTEPSIYTLQIDAGVHLVPGDAAWAMMNHSCAPNCVIDIGRRRVLALRAIAPGEELTFNYLTTEWDMASPFPCRCGAAHCPGMIRGYRFLGAAQREAIGSHVARYLLRLAVSDSGTDAVSGKGGERRADSATQV